MLCEITMLKHHAMRNHHTMRNHHAMRPANPQSHCSEKKDPLRISVKDIFRNALHPCHLPIYPEVLPCHWGSLDRSAHLPRWWMKSETICLMTGRAEGPDCLLSWCDKWEMDGRDGFASIPILHNHTWPVSITTVVFPFSLPRKHVFRSKSSVDINTPLLGLSPFLFQPRSPTS